MAHGAEVSLAGGLRHASSDMLQPADSVVQRRPRRWLTLFPSLPIPYPCAGVSLTYNSQLQPNYITEQADVEQLLMENGAQPPLDARQQVTAALAAVSSFKPVGRLGAGAFGETHKCIIELPLAASGHPPAHIAVAVKAMGFKHQISADDNSLNHSGLAQGLGPSCVRKIDINTPLMALHELSANQAVAGSRHFATLLSHRISMSGVLFVFELVGNGTTLSKAVQQQQPPDGTSSAALTPQQQCSTTSAAAMSPKPPSAKDASSCATLPPLLLEYLLRFGASAINTLHGVGWVHLDLKPDNMLLTHQLQPKVADLGTAAQMGTLVGGVGTPLFMAPQVGSGGGWWGSRGKRKMFAVGCHTCHLLACVLWYGI